MPYEPPPELAALSLSEVADLVARRRLPPVDQWRPREVGDSEMRIAADGRWYHQGGIISRPAMVRAFASLLVREDDGRHWLVTPTQKLAIAVEDAAFLAVDVKAEGGALAFRLNSDDLVIAGPEHPLRAAGTEHGPALYLGVRHGTEARINRSTWAQLVEIALASGETDAAGLPAVSSEGVRFPLVAAPTA